MTNIQPTHLQGNSSLDGTGNDLVISVGVFKTFLEEEYKEDKLAVTILTNTDLKVASWVIIHSVDYTEGIGVRYSKGYPTFTDERTNAEIPRKDIVATIHADFLDLEKYGVVAGDEAGFGIDSLTDEVYSDLAVLLNLDSEVNLSIKLHAVARGDVQIYGTHLPTDKYARLLNQVKQ